MVETEYHRAKVPPYNGNDPPPAPDSLKALLFPTLLNEVQNKGAQGLQARYGAELPPFISIVRCPGRPVLLGKPTGVFGRGGVLCDASGPSFLSIFCGIATIAFRPLLVLQACFVGPNSEGTSCYCHGVGNYCGQILGRELLRYRLGKPPRFRGCS